MIYGGTPPPVGTPPTDITSVELSLSTDPTDWIGSLGQISQDHWTLRAADLSIDKLTGKTHLRSRSFTDRLMELARREGWTGIHHYGVGDFYALTSAVAAAELELPFLLSFAPGEAQSILFEKAADLRAALRASTAFTAPSQHETNLIDRFLSEKRTSVVVPTALPEDHGRFSLSTSEAALWEAVPRPLLGCWGRHGRTSGLATMLDLVQELSASLLLVGPFEAAEMYDWSPRIDHHPMSERIFRVGKRSPEESVALLRVCDLAVFPMALSSQANYALRSLSGGAKVVSSRVGVLADVEGLSTVAVGADWTAPIREKLLDWKEPAGNWRCAFSTEAVNEAWKRAYLAGGLCT